MFGGDLPTSDPEVLALLTNDDVLAVNQTGESPRQVSREGERVVWCSDVPGANERYVALFNLADGDAGISIAWSAVGLGERALVRDLWAGGGWTEPRLALTEPVPAHGARLFHVR
jgi:hypothetical protein